jgi:hypothetical protein
MVFMYYSRSNCYYGLLKFTNYEDIFIIKKKKIIIIINKNNSCWFLKQLSIQKMITYFVQTTS